MRIAILAITLAALAGCLRSTSHQCADASECPGGMCVMPQGACAFDDGLCSSGLRFGEATGTLAGLCVAGPDDVDAAASDATDSDGTAADAPTDGGATDARVDAPPTTHDEDGDTINDAIDNCPHVGNTNQLDVGEAMMGRVPDGVGDACDPDPELSGNSILLFDALTSLVPGRWNSSQAAVEGDAIKLDPDGYLSTMATYPGKIFVANQVRMTNPGANGANASIASSYVSSANRLACIRASTPSNIIVDGPGATFPYATGPVTTGGPIVIRQTIDPSRWTCSTTHNGQTHTAWINGTPAPGGGRVFMGALVSVVYVDYLVVIERP